jgi:hypothetical protein
MTSPTGYPFLSVGMIACLLAALLCSSCQLCDPAACGPCGTDCDDCANKARVCHEPTVRALAHDLDDLERHIEKYGSVVVKQPDVWGQARLTKHREEFEQQMAAQLDQFDYTLQGSLWQSDQAYFADAFALSAAAGAKVGGTPAAPSSPGTGSKPPSTTPPARSTPQPPQPPSTPALPGEEGDVFAAFAKLERSPLAAHPALEFAHGKTQ